MNEIDIGTDKVRVTPEVVCIFAAREMPDWTVREFCRRPIFFQRRNDRLYQALICLYPFIGFCWFSTKERFFAPLGFEAREVTGASVMLEFCLTMAQAILIFYLGSGLFNLCFGSEILGFRVFWLDVSLFLVLPVDCLVRYGRLLKGDEVPAGFFEWVFKR